MTGGRWVTFHRSPSSVCCKEAAIPSICNRTAIRLGALEATHTPAAASDSHTPSGIRKRVRFRSKADVIVPFLEASRECVLGSSSCEENEIVTNARRRLEPRVLSLEDLSDDRKWLTGFLR